MTVAGLIRAAQTKVIVNRVTIWNHNISRVLYSGSFCEIPEKLKYKVVNSYDYNKEKEKMIIRI